MNVRRSLVSLALPDDCPTRLTNREKNKFTIISFNLLKNNLRVDVKSLDKRLTEHFVAAIINFDLVGCLCSFGSNICGSL